jgi:hypothetical protein
VFSGLAIVFSSLLSPIGSPIQDEYLDHSYVTADFSATNFDDTDVMIGAAGLPADSGESHISEFIEEDREDDASDAFCWFDTLSFLTPNGPTKVWSSLVPGKSPSNCVSLPLRC